MLATLFRLFLAAALGLFITWALHVGLGWPYWNSSPFGMLVTLTVVIIQVRVLDYISRNQ